MLRITMTSGETTEFKDPPEHLWDTAVRVMQEQKGVLSHEDGTRRVQLSGRHMIKVVIEDAPEFVGGVMTF